MCWTEDLSESRVSARGIVVSAEPALAARRRCALGVTSVVLLAPWLVACAASLDARPVERGRTDDRARSVVRREEEPVERPGPSACVPLVRFSPVGRARRLFGLADVDGDGRLDAVMGSTFGGLDHLEVALGDDTGYFEVSSSVPISARAHYAAVADFDEDGRADVASLDSPSRSVVLYSGRPDGSLRRGRAFPIGDGAMEIASSDLDGDGHADLAINHSRGLRLLLGDGHGSFARAPEIRVGLGSLPVVADVDGDGRPDLVHGWEGSDRGPSDFVLRLGLGRGRFSEGRSLPRMYAAEVDVDGDGRDEVALYTYVQTSDDPVHVRFLGASPSADFEVGSGWMPALVRDVTGDHRADLVIRQLLLHPEHRDAYRVLPGDGRGGFGPPGERMVLLGLGPRSHLADVDGDGRPELILLMNGNPFFPTDSEEVQLAVQDLSCPPGGFAVRAITPMPLPPTGTAPPQPAEASRLAELVGRPSVPAAVPSCSRFDSTVQLFEADAGARSPFLALAGGRSRVIFGTMDVPFRAIRSPGRRPPTRAPTVIVESWSAALDTRGRRTTVPTRLARTLVRGVAVSDRGDRTALIVGSMVPPLSHALIVLDSSRDPPVVLAETPLPWASSLAGAVAYDPEHEEWGLLLPAEGSRLLFARAARDGGLRSPPRPLPVTSVSLANGGRPLVWGGDAFVALWNEGDGRSFPLVLARLGAGGELHRVEVSREGRSGGIAYAGGDRFGVAYDVTENGRSSSRAAIVEGERVGPEWRSGGETVRGLGSPIAWDGARFAVAFVPQEAVPGSPGRRHGSVHYAILDSRGVELRRGHAALPRAGPPDRPMALEHDGCRFVLAWERGSGASEVWLSFFSGGGAGAPGP